MHNIPSLISFAVDSPADSAATATEAYDGVLKLLRHFGVNKFPNCTLTHKLTAEIDRRN